MVLTCDNATSFEARTRHQAHALGRLPSQDALRQLVAGQYAMPHVPHHIDVAGPDARGEAVLISVCPLQYLCKHGCIHMSLLKPPGFLLRLPYSNHSDQQTYPRTGWKQVVATLHEHKAAACAEVQIAPSMVEYFMIT